MAQEIWTIRIDGASRGNPGPAAFALIIERDGQPDLEEAGVLDKTTNNVAEYAALLKALARAREMRGERLMVYSDSELLVKQMNGQYRVKNADLKELHTQALALVDEFEAVEFRHVRREQNARADALCNQALDRQKKEPVPPRNSGGNGRDQVIACLQRAAIAWSAGDPKQPDPEVVWREIWGILTATIGEK